MKNGAVASYWSRLLFWTGLLNGLVLGGLIIGWLFNYRFAETPFWLMGCWQLLAAQGLLAIVVMVRRLLHRRWGPALAWLLWATLGLGLCAATMLPVMVLNGAGTSVGEPAPGSPERIESDRLDSLLTRIYAAGLDSLIHQPNPRGEVWSESRLSRWP